MTTPEKVSLMEKLMKDNPDLTIKEFMAEVRKIERVEIDKEIQHVISIVTINTNRHYKKAI